MARDRTTVNRITERIETDRRRSTRNVWKYGIPIVLLASVIIPLCIPLWVLIWLVIYQSVKKRRLLRHAGRAAGEELALTHLSRLSDEYPFSTRSAFQIRGPAQVTGKRILWLWAPMEFL